MGYTPDGLWYAFWFSVLIVLFLLIPYCLDLWWTYKLEEKRDIMVQDMMKSSIQEYVSRAKSLDADKCGEHFESTIKGLFDAVMADFKVPIEGIKGFTRGMIAFAVILIMGISMMLIMFANVGDPQLVNNIISMLAATLAAVVGFYFGGRTSQEAMTVASEKQQPKDTTPPQTKQPTKKQDIEPVLKVNGIKIGKTAVFENGVWISQKDVDIYGYWDTYGKDSLETHMVMDPQTLYSLYCNVESSNPDDQYEIYIEPMLIKQKDFETRPFIDGRQNFVRMFLHPKHKTWYVKDFEWFPKYDNWREPGDYILIIKKGYLKPGHTIGTIPTWAKEPEEFKIKLT